jgi:O-antigen ligase
MWGYLEFLFFRDPSGRVQASFFHPNVFAFYLTIVIGLIYFLLSSAKITVTDRYRTIAILYSFMLIVLVVLTQCRSAWVGVGLILFLYAALINQKYLLLLCFLPAALLVPQVSARLSDLSQGQYEGGKLGEDGINSYAWRELMWSSALEDAADEPLLGKGLSSFGPNSLIFFPLVDPNAAYSQKGVGAHSVYVQTIYETGYIGLVCYVGMFCVLVLNALRYFRKDPGGVIMIIALIVAFAAENYSDNMLDYGAVNFYFWGMMGIVFANWEQRARDASAARQGNYLGRLVPKLAV